MKVSTISEMRALDRKAIEQYGITAELLMENAGQAVYYVILKEFGVVGRRFVVLCGLGNNGGDGLVVARKLHSSGGLVSVLILGNPDKFRGAAETNFGIVSRLPIEVRRPQSIQAVADELAGCDAVVDAMLGTGITGDVRGLYRDVIEALNQSGKTVFSVDIPSGVDGDTGRVRGAAVRADYTVTFGLPKIGNVLTPGYDLCGKLYVSHISFPPAMIGASSLQIATNEPVMPASRPEKGNDRASGGVLFILGATQPTVVESAALSFLTTAGRIQLAVPRSMTQSVAIEGARVAITPLTETSAGSIALENKDLLLDMAADADVVGLGLGLTLDPETRRLIHELVGEIRTPLVIGGVGVRMISADPRILQQRKAESAVICDTAELASIAGITASEVHADPVSALQRACDRLKATIVWMRAQLLVGLPDGRVFINTRGGGRRAAGNGLEVLLGMIAGMSTSALTLVDAARNAVFVHGACVALAASERAEDRITPQVLLDRLPRVVEMIREKMPEDQAAGLYLV
ncbi:MAG: NAD(P)H-hydrate epimerase [Anaerolineae bacterium]